MLSSDWFPFPGLATGADWFPFPRLDLSFPGLAKGSDWFAGGGVRSGDFQRLLDFQRLFSGNLTKWSSLDSSVSEGDKYAEGRQPYSLYCKSRNV